MTISPIFNEDLFPYPKHSFKKLHARASGPFHIIRKLESKHFFYLPSDMTISPIFNEDLFPYRGTFEPLKMSVDIPIGGGQTSSVSIPKLLPVHQLVRE